MVGTSRIRLACASAILVGAVLSAGCANPHMAALKAYDGGDPATAEKTLGPLLEKQDKNAILYLWDVGMFRFAQGNSLKANEAWMKTGELVGVEPGSLQTSVELFKSDASKTFIGDPVEYSMAFLYVGLGYYTMGDYENAMVAFKKSLEWDYSGDAERQGDMMITNLMLGECYARAGESDQAVVAYRRVLRGNPECVPALVGLCRELKKAGKSMEAEKSRAELASRVPKEYLDGLDRCSDGVLVVIMSGYVPKVKGDAFLGAFRVRSEVSTPIHHWQVGCVELPAPSEASRADTLMTHLKDQGGEKGQAVRKGAQVVAGALMKQVPILGLFAPKTEADVRYWSTLPGEVYAAYLPLEPGLHSIRAMAFDKKGKSLDNYRQTWHYIPVSQGGNTILVVISHKNLQTLM
jgi:hypothetical protein